MASTKKRDGASGNALLRHEGIEVLDSNEITDVPRCVDPPTFAVESYDPYLRMS